VVFVIISFVTTITIIAFFYVITLHLSYIIGTIHLFIVFMSIANTFTTNHRCVFTNGNVDFVQ